jgi:crossover junction endodeoxyribonuclease RuvC
MIVAGIDPGLSGAIAWLDSATGAVVDIADMPVHVLARGGKAKREIDVHALVRLVAARRPGHAFVEQVGAMPGQGVSSTFSFGRAFGTIIGVSAATGTPYTLVAAVKWKRALGVPAAKDGSRARASQLMPAAAHHWPLVKHDGRAEAALIAYYGLRSLGAIVTGEAA